MMTTIKERIRPVVEGALRHLPVARAAYAAVGICLERNWQTRTLPWQTRTLPWQTRTLPWRIMRCVRKTSSEKLPAFFGADAASRDRLFDAFAAVDLSDYLYVRAGRAIDL